MITVEEVIILHDILVERFGGANGIRDYGSLSAAIARPYQTFDGTELYPDSVAKAAAVFESIISNHPFIDGNKRTAYVLMQLILKADNLEIRASENEKYDFVINAASGELTIERIKNWINQYLK